MISTEGKTIAVLGATGRQGGQVVRHLLNQGWQVRAITRKPESKKALIVRELGADIVKADLGAGIGNLAQSNLTRQPSRVAVTASASMLGLAVIVAAGASLCQHVWDDLWHGER